MRKLTAEVLEKRYWELKSRSFTESIPQNIAEWRELLKLGDLDDFPGGVAILNDEYLLQDCNETYAGYMNRTRANSAESAFGKSIFEYMPGIDSSPAANVLTEVMLFGVSKIELEREITIRIGDQQQTTFWDANLIPLFREGRKVAGVALFCINTTDQKIRDQSQQSRDIQIEDLKTALRVLNNLRNEDKIDLENNMRYNALSIALPLLDKLKTGTLSEDQVELISAIESSLNSLTSSFSKKLVTTYNLTSKETMIASLVKEGKTTKEIACLLDLSLTTIDFHRNNIRKKTGINRQNISLRSFLISLD